MGPILKLLWSPAAQRGQSKQLQESPQKVELSRGHVRVGTWNRCKLSNWRLARKRCIHLSCRTDFGVQILQNIAFAGVLGPVSLCFFLKSRQNLKRTFTFLIMPNAWKWPFRGPQMHCFQFKMTIWQMAPVSCVYGGAGYRLTLSGASCRKLFPVLLPSNICEDLWLPDTGIPALNENLQKSATTASSVWFVCDMGNEPQPLRSPKKFK